MLSSNTVMPALRVAQFTLAFVTLGLSAYVAHWYNVETIVSPPPQIGWLLFVSLFTIISVGLLEGLPRFAPRFFHPYAAFTLEIGNAIFYLAGFTALSTYMGILPYCRGSICRAARADVAFGLFEFLLWIISAALTGRDLRSKFRRSSIDNKQAPLGAPPMKEAPAP